MSPFYSGMIIGGIVGSLGGALGIGILSGGKIVYYGNLVAFYREQLKDLKEKIVGFMVLEDRWADEIEQKDQG